MGGGQPPTGCWPVEVTSAIAPRPPRATDALCLDLNRERAGRGVNEAGRRASILNPGCDRPQGGQPILEKKRLHPQTDWSNCSVNVAPELDRVPPPTISTAFIRPLGL